MEIRNQVFGFAQTEEKNLVSLHRPEITWKEEAS